jgi:hypothetical protein
LPARSKKIAAGAAGLDFQVSQVIGIDQADEVHEDR